MESLCVEAAIRRPKGITLGLYYAMLTCLLAALLPFDEGFDNSSVSLC